MNSCAHTSSSSILPPPHRHGLKLQIKSPFLYPSSETVELGAGCSGVVVSNGTRAIKRLPLAKGIREAFLSQACGMKVLDLARNTQSPKPTLQCHISFRLAVPWHEWMREFSEECFAPDFLQHRVLFASLAKHLSSIHDRGLVHGDVSLFNVVKLKHTFEPEFKLVDFGSCQIQSGLRLECHPLFTEPGTQKQRAAVMQDVYALGCLVYVLVAMTLGISLEDTFRSGTDSNGHLKLDFNRLNKLCEHRGVSQQDMALIPFVQSLLCPDVRQRPTLPKIILFLEGDRDEISDRRLTTLSSVFISQYANIAWIFHAIAVLCVVPHYLQSWSSIRCVFFLCRIVLDTHSWTPNLKTSSEEDECLGTSLVDLCHDLQFRIPFL